MASAKDSPLFSVLVPTYNHGRYVGAALDSLLSQTRPDWEALVVNDGSTDDTPQVIDAYARRDPRIRVFNKPNGGCASALNLGLEHAVGEWVLWLSSDDTFEPDKLAIHVEWFKRRPHVRFFHTHFFHRDLATGDKSAPPLWRRLPEDRWQVLEMLESTYIAPLTMCVHRSLFGKVKHFDEGLRWAQDYDMMLRLLRVAVAFLIDERTCSMGQHPAQGSAVEGATNIMMDAGRSCIRFLNAHGFRDLFPAMDLDSEHDTMLALDHALDAAANPHAFLYKAGAHPALLGRILEWIHDPARGRYGRRLRRMFLAYSRKAVVQHRETPLGMWWKAARVVSETLGCRPMTCGPVDAADAVHAHTGFAWATGDPLWRTYATYLARFCDRKFEPPEHKTNPAESLFVTPEGTRLEPAALYGALRMTTRMAGALVDRGGSAVLFGLRDVPLGFFEGVPAVGCETDWDIKQALSCWGNTDNLVTVGRSDALLATNAKRRIVYHHTTHPIPGGLSPETMNGLGVSILAVSDYSRRQLIGLGHNTTRVRLVTNTYDDRVFGLADRQRDPMRLLFIGGLAHYKGVDIALQAFRRIRAAEPRATLTVCGHVLDDWPRDSSLSYLARCWLGADGLLDPIRVQSDLQGTAFVGFVAPPELAGLLQQSGLLLLPSRYGENFPLVALEAQACGCWPVLPRHMALPETVRDGETGILYQPNTPEALAATVLRLLRDDLPRVGQRVAASDWMRGTFAPAQAGATFAAALSACDTVTAAEQRYALALGRRMRTKALVARLGRRLRVACRAN
jgi:glycosyltransferase involved in cell wall biosynthesis